MTTSSRVKALLISIHALREEGDGVRSAPERPESYFNPRPPRGGRPATSTCEVIAYDISIHALREEGDPNGR